MDSIRGQRYIGSVDFAYYGTFNVSSYKNSTESYYFNYKPGVSGSCVSFFLRMASIQFNEYTPDLVVTFKQDDVSTRN